MRTYGGHNVHRDMAYIAEGVNPNAYTNQVQEYLSEVTNRRDRRNMLQAKLKNVVSEYYDQMISPDFDKDKTIAYFRVILDELCLEELEESVNVLGKKGPSSCLIKLKKLYN